MTTRLERVTPADDWRGWCPNDDCPCWRAGVPCEEFMGWPGDDGCYPHCPRCGWHERHHVTAMHRAVVLFHAARKLDDQAAAHNESITDYTDLLRVWAADTRRWDDGS